MDKVIVKSKYNKKFHLKFYYFHMFRKAVSFYFYLLAGVLALYLAIQNTLDEAANLTNIMISWGFAILIFLMIPVFLIGKVIQVVKQNQKERKDTLELLEFTKAKIVRRIEGQESKTILGWEQFESAYELLDCFFLYIDKDRGLVIVKTDIVEGGVELFRKLIIQNFPKNKKGQPKFKKMYKEIKHD
ncbi:MAG: YcxB family protein [Bacilli bacterium]